MMGIDKLEYLITNSINKKDNLYHDLNYYLLIKGDEKKVKKIIDKIVKVELRIEKLKDFSQQFKDVAEKQKLNKQQ